MKQSIFISIILFSFFACKNSPKVEKATTGEAAGAITNIQSNGMAKIFNIDTNKSQIEWIGYKPAKYEHKGIITLLNGQIAVLDGAISSGSFDLDMNNLSVTDLKDPKEKADLEEHLKNEDFFETNKFPLAKFIISKVEPMLNDTSATHKITGDLTIKNTTKSISFPAKVTIKDKMLSASTPKFSINRAEFGVTYSSSVIGTIKDKLIADDVPLKISLFAMEK